MKINTKWTLFLISTFTVFFGIADSLLKQTYSSVDNVTGNIDLKYNVLYYSNRVSEIDNEMQSYSTGSNYIVLGSLFSDTSGYVFDSWNTTVDGTGDKYIEGDVINLNKDIELYAQWVLNSNDDEIEDIKSSVNTLESITLSVGKLNESFDKYKTKYTASVDSESVIIDVIKTDKNSTVIGDGIINLNYGDNEINIIVISETGYVKIYKVIICRNKKDDYITGEYSV